MLVVLYYYYYNSNVSQIVKDKGLKRKGFSHSQKWRFLHDFNLCGMDRQMDGPTLLKRCKNSSNNSVKSSTNIQALIFQLCLVRCFKVLFKSSFIANRFGVGYKIPEIVCLVMQKHFIHQGTIVDQNYQLMYFKQGPTLAK